MAGLATPMALRVAVTLGLPDRLLGDGACVDELAVELTVAPVALDLLLGHLATLGVVERTSTGYRTTGYGTNLCADAGNGLIDLLHLDAAGGRAELAFVELAHSITTGQAAYARRYGQDFWADLAEYPYLRESFDRQMAHRFREQIPRIVAGFDWSRFSSIVDVGGGQGSLLAAILAAHPRMHGHLVDLEPTAAQAHHTFSAHDLDGRTQVTAGSFFDPLPAGAQAYLLVDILHDWDDEHAHRILNRCVEAAYPAGRVLIIEPVGGLGAASEFNLAMLVMYGGRERRIDEFRTLAAPHGLILDTVTDLTDQRCLLEFRLAADELTATVVSDNSDRYPMRTLENNHRDQ
ncbi:methyltransferase [Nocardia vinacea]|uniref:methyltransferase n=1 Tax=Nocardia vinacea TaxID=96468 RepID=UPI002E12AAE0|nr:methyltransferase [Nocardia vinacea]